MLTTPYHRHDSATGDFSKPVAALVCGGVVACFLLPVPAILAMMVGSKETLATSDAAQSSSVVWGWCDITSGQHWCDTTLSAATRAEALVRQMTVEEKSSLLRSNAAAVPRLGIGAYNYWSEGLHGVARAGHATSFPQVIGLSSSFNSSLWELIGRATAIEARGLNNALSGELYRGLTLWAPNVNIFRDARWGRGQETPGEDPALSGAFATHFVRGMQGRSAHGGGALLASAALKHFVAYDREEGRLSFAADVSPQDMHDTYLPPFRDGIQEGGASGLMCAYSAQNMGLGATVGADATADEARTHGAIPSCANRGLLTGLVREVYGFDGYVTTDCGAAEGLGMGRESHGYASDANQTVRALLRAGVDTSCGFPYTNPLLGDVTVTAPLLHDSDEMSNLADASLVRLISVQMRLGFFDAPDRGEFGHINGHAVDTPQHRALAREAAEQSLVLLSNHRRTLPLRRGSTRHVAVIGALADEPRNQLGNYYGEPLHLTSVLDGVRAHANVEHLSGDNAAAAEEAARREDVDAVVVVIGLRSEAGAGVTQVEERQQGDGTQRPLDEAEGLDRTSLLLPHNQSYLVRAVAAAAATAAKQRPVVLVLICGGSMDVSEFDSSDSGVGAILWAGYPGQSGGEAIADTLFGLVSPSGRLTTTWHREDFAQRVAMEQMGIRPTLGYPGRTHRFFDASFYNGPEPLYTFGHGLSYTRCSEYIVAVAQSDAPIPLQSVGWADAPALRREVLAEVTVRVRHVGGPAGAHVVLLFASPPPVEVVLRGAPRQVLVAFKRIEWLEVNESINVVLDVTALSLSFARDDAQGTRIISRGDWALWVVAGEHTEMRIFG